MKGVGKVQFFGLAFSILAGLFCIQTAAAGNAVRSCSTGKDASAQLVIKTPTDGGIREQIPDKYRDRYDRWKAEFLAAETGRRQWKSYAANKNFILTIKISDEEKEGAGTADYLWNTDGKLVGATINLGSKLEKGYPDPIYFPVMNSISIADSNARTRENILAAAKIAHEFGHVNQAARTGGELFQLQNKLIVEYNEILEKNSFDMNTPALAELRERLGGTPVEVWENREYWGETNAMLYLLDRLETEHFFCPVVSKIETNIKTFAVSYEERFSPVFQSSKVCRD